MNDLIIAAIRAVTENVDADMWALNLLDPMSATSITLTNYRIAMFIGQVAAESDFKTLEENLTYIHPERLCEVWPHEFPDEDSALVCTNNPEALANRVYAGKLGNGDADSGDGWTFRGAGLIQLTGRTMFTEFGTACGKSPEDAAAWCLTPQGAAESACWYWSHHGLNVMADGWRVTEATRIINGSTQDAPRRIKMCNEALKAILAA